jgi:hypothetical protein
LSFSIYSFIAARAQGPTPAASANRSPVVVELFTSEGCSSCPPADALLQKLQKQQPIAGAEVIALEEHVDYWNHLGWSDPYSSHEWTLRQQNYGEFFNDDAYTPQLVVNGQSQFVGSDERQATREIAKAAQGAKAAVSITVGDADGKGSQRLTVSVGKLVGEMSGDVAEVWLAVTEDGLHSAVSRGENSGRVLNHVATLRSLQKIGIADAHGVSGSFTGDELVKLDPRWVRENLHVLVFVQARKNRQVLGAASTRI